MNLPKAEVAHVSPGRMRVRIPTRKGDGTFFGDLTERAAGLEGIDRVTANPVTGSVLIQHTMTSKDLARLAARNGLFSCNVSGRSRPRVYSAVKQGIAGVDRNIRLLTGSQLDLASVAFIGLLAAGVYQIVRGNFAAPAWYTAFWYALNIFSKSGHEEEADGGVE